MPNPHHECIPDAVHIQKNKWRNGDLNLIDGNVSFRSNGEKRTIRKCYKLVKPLGVLKQTENGFALFI